MGQVNLRLPKNDFDLLDLIAKKKNIPVTSLFKMIIDENFQKWKIETVLQLHLKGEINFKQALNYSGLAPFEYIEALEKSELEPLSSEIIENKTLETALNLENKQIFKSPNFKRRSKEITKEITEKS